MESFSYSPLILGKWKFKCCIEIKLRRSKIQRGQILWHFLIIFDHSFVWLVGMAYNSTNWLSLIRNSNQYSNLMLSLVNESLSAVKRVDPHAQILQIILLLKGNTMRQLINCISNFNFWQFIFNTAFKVWTRTISKILLSNDINLMVAVFLFDGIDDEVLYEVVNLYLIMLYLCDWIIFSFPTQLSTTWILMQNLAWSGYQVKQI